jgi:pimeloyl-ACP methyl ester carboxylesterase
MSNRITFTIAKYVLPMAILAAIAGYAFSGHRVVRAAGPSGVRNILLVHGAWADGSSWQRVIARLDGDGYNVTAVQLPLSSLADDVAVVNRALAREDGPTLLVGHSYGGVVITEAGIDPKVAGLVYVSAFAPDEGESALSLGGTVPPTPITADFVSDSSGMLKISSAGIAADFAQDLPPREQAILAATQGPISAPNALAAKISYAAWKRLPTWYAVASNDRVIAPSLEATMAQRMNAKTIVLRSGHLSILSHSEEVSELVEKAAGSLNQ